MSITETLGLFWIILTSALGTAIVMIGAYSAIRRHLDLAKLGTQVEMDAAMLREQDRILRR
jgi:hypothetical protein